MPFSQYLCRPWTQGKHTDKQKSSDMNNGWMNGYNSKQFCKIIFLGYGRKL